MLYQDDPDILGKRPYVPPPLKVPVRVKSRLFCWFAYLGLLLVLLNLVSGIADSPLAYAVSVPHQITLKGAPSTPNTSNPTAGSTSQTRTFAPGAPGNAQPHAPVSIGYNVPLPMKAGSVDLQVGKPTSFLGSDGRLELQIPAGAITAQDLTAAGGKITLHVTQIAPASGSNAGGSGEISFGTFLIQLTDGHGKLLTHGLRKALTTLYHLKKGESGLHLQHALLLLNGAVAANTSRVSGVVQPATGTSLTSTMGQPHMQQASLDNTGMLLTASPLVSTPSTSMSFDGSSPIATFGKPNPTSVSLSAGALSYSEPLALPAGPGGLTPPVSLTYSSEGVNEQHSASAGVGWVGEGWNLSLGSINWSEQNTTAGCNGCTATWDGIWQLSDPYGTSDEIIPPDAHTSTYFDDSPNAYCATGGTPTVACPILWHTATESHDKIYAYVGPLNIGQGVNPPCFRVWLPNGIMEEFGCTLDSLQYYYEAGLGALVTGWNLDMITDPQGNQIHVTYQQDMENWTSPSTGHVFTYPRDVQVASVQYDSPSCHNAQTMCTGSNWAPQMQVVFNASHSVANPTGTTPSGCNTSANMRCDDPVDLSGNNGFATSLIQSTFVLNSVQTQVRTSGTGSWNTLNTYNLSYEQSGPTTTTDPVSGIARSTGGMLDLTQIQQVGTTDTSALLYSGEDNSASSSFAYMKLFDLSSKNIVVGPNTTLSYWIYPQSRTTNGLVSGNNSTCVAIDMVFTDGTDLRDSGAVDQNGNQLHPAHQCGRLVMDQWNLVTSVIGAKVSGKTISRLDEGYDQPANTGGYRGYLDDISITDPSSSTPLFATGFESGDPPQTWTNTVDTTAPGGGLTNIGGICCGLTGPESWSGGQAVFHNLLPSVTFTYTSLTNYYVDSSDKPNPTTNCGPSWNTGNGSGCPLWSQSYANGDRYLSSISNGQGLVQTFSWSLAHNNTHGVNGGGNNNANPFYCNGNQGSYPCNETDDMGWSHVVLTQQNDTTMRLSQAGQVGAQNDLVNFHGTNDGNWNNVQSATVTVSLDAGNNTLLFSNPSGWVPNIDRITVNGTSYEAEASGNTLAGGAVVQSCSACSGGQEVGFIGNGGTLQINNVHVTSAGSYPLTIFYIDGDAGRSAQMTVNGANTPITSTTNYNYQLTYPLTAQECSDCVAGMYWGNQNDANFLNYFDAKFMGFAQTTVALPSGAVEVHKYYAGEGWGLYDTTQVTCFQTSPCHNDPWWDLANAAHGQEYQAQYYDTDGTTLLKQVNTTTQVVCPPSGVSGTPNFDGFSFNGQLVSELGKNNPVAVCEIHPTQQTTQTYDGASNPVTTTSNLTYDSFGRVTQVATTSNGGTPSNIVQNTSYVWNDGVTATQSSASGTYIINKVAFTNTEDGSGNRLACSYLSYDGQSYTLGQMNNLTGGLQTAQDNYANCGTSANSYTPSGPSTTTTVYDAFGNTVGSNDADANAGISGHTGCTVSSVQHTVCTAYDGTFAVFPTSSSNALNQTGNTSYSNTSALYGFGTWPVSTTDANSQTTNVTYDALGRMTGEALPGETSGEQTTQWAYTNWCSSTIAQAPCEEIDEIDRLNSSTTITKRAFYDGEGRLIETRTSGPVGQDVVTYVTYDTAGRQIFKSNSYFVTAYTGTPGAAAYSIPDSTQPGTSTNYPTLRQTSVTDPNSHATTTTVSVICGVSGTSDTGCYEQTMTVDANGHEGAMLTGGLGETNYRQTYTGNSTNTYALYSTTTYTYDPSGNWISTESPDGTIATANFDALGREISQNDSDSGAANYTYDPNSNLIASVDARGSAGTVYYGYDALNRQLWRNSTNSPTDAWITYTYDNTANGNLGIGEATGESFTGSGGLSGSYAFTYDARGRQIGQVTTINGTNYSTQATYADNGTMLSVTYPTGEVVTSGYDNNGWLLGLNTVQGTTTTTLASNLAYSGLAGAAGQITTMDFGSGDIYNASYDNGMRITSASLTQAGTNELLYQTQPAYDAANNVVNVQTSISGATDTQQFCYDSLDRLTWAGSTGTPPCASLTSGSLTAAQYQQSDSYNIDGGLINGPNGSYTYGDSSHPHTVTSTSGGYSAAYDAAGNLICRALTNATTCNGTQTGQQLSYDPQGRLTNWQNQPNSPTQTANYLYDGSGNRVAMQTVVNGTTTFTAYINDIEEVQKTGSTTQTTTYYYMGGQRIAANVNGSFYYFGYDVLGSQVAVFNNNGNLIGSQLYGPYGNQRYVNGSLPTSIGFTGQQADSVTGLDYYNARYYDPAVGGFLTPDWIQGNILGMNPYAYVSGNPETLTDPTGLCDWWNVVCEGQQVIQGTEQVFEHPGEIIPGIEEGASTLWEDFGGALGGALGDTLDFLTGPIGGFLLWTITWLANPTPLAPAQVAPSHSGGGGHKSGSSGGGGHGGGGGGGGGGNPPPPNKGGQNHARKTLGRLEGERQATSPRPSARSEGVLSDGRILTQNSFSYKPGNPATPSPDFGSVDTKYNNGKRAFCAEARCMQEAQDIYGNNPPYGFNEFWETQAQGSGPCLNGCTPGFENFSNQFGPTRVWWQDAQGVLHSQDFVNGNAGSVMNHP